MATINDTQLLSLVDNPIENEFHAQRIDQQQQQQGSASLPRRSSFWKGLFQRRRGGENEEEEDLEGSALLDSCPDLQFDSRRDDDDELDDYRDGEGNSSHRARLLQSNDSDDDDDDDDELYYKNGEVWSGKDKGNVTSTNALRNMHSSEPVLKYSPRANGTVNDESDSDDDDDEDEDDDDEDESGDDEDEDVNDSLHETTRYQPPQLASSSPVQPLRNFLQRSQSVSSQSYYSDNRSGFGDDGLSVDTSNRKNIHGRIQGFGSDPSRTPTQGSDPLPGARNLRQRLLDLTSAYRMRKMAIGTEESLQRKTWVERFDEVVDRVLPPDPELDGYIDAFKITGQAIVVMPHEEPSDPEDNDTPATKAATSSLREPPVIDTRPQSRGKAGAIGYRRQALGNIDDAAYIMHLECELQNKELELHSWKRRIKELEAEVQRLKGLRDEGDDESQGSSSESSSKEGKDPGVSEIEWQTGVVEEGVLIEIESSAPEAMVDQEQATTQRTLSTHGEAATFVISHAPDGPNGDEEVANGSQPMEKDETKYDNDDFFPVLSSKNRESATMWIDENPTAKPSEPSSPVKVGLNESTDISNDKDDEDEQEQSDEEEEEEEDDDDGDEEDEDDNNDDDEEEEEDADEEEEEEEEREEKAKGDDLVPPEEDLLIILDDPHETMPTSTVDMGIAVVSDDDDGSENHATKKSNDESVGDGCTISSIIKDPQLDDIPTMVQSDMTLIDLGS